MSMNIPEAPDSKTNNCFFYNLPKQTDFKVIAYDSLIPPKIITGKSKLYQNESKN